VRDACPRWSRGSLYACESGDHAVGVAHPCRAGHCPECADDVTARRAGRRLAAVGGAGIRAVVLTVPPGPDGTWSWVTWELAREIRRAAWATYRQWLRSIHGESLLVGGYAVVHPAGDRCHACNWTGRGEAYHRSAAVHGACLKCGELARWRPHVHLAASEIAVQDGSLYTLPRMYHRDQLRNLKQAWKAALMALGAPEHVPNVNLAWRVQGPPTAHRVEYDLRAWPAWISGGKRHISRKVLRVTVYGLCTGAAKNPAAQAWKARVRDTTRTEEGELSAIVCPICGKNAHYSLTTDAGELALLAQRIIRQHETVYPS
jgi:hypothetical protein